MHSFTSVHNLSQTKPSTGSWILNYKTFKDMPHSGHPITDVGQFKEIIGSKNELMVITSFGE